MARKLVTCFEAVPANQAHLALCKLVLSGSTPPEWVELVPAGPEVHAVDGRSFRNSKPEDVVARFKDYGLDLPIDWEHATEKLASTNVGEAPAAGWITELEVRAGAIWGKVEWTPRGLASLTNREYRYISPAFTHKKDGEVLNLVSAGLTNKPALTQLAAVASAKTDASIEASEDSMDPKILKALGLGADATPEQVAAAIEALKVGTVQIQGELATARAELTKVPDISKFVPRADYEVLLARASAAEAAAATEKANQLKLLVNTEIEAAMKAGKILPATKSFYVAICEQEGGLEKFREFVKVQATIGDAETFVEPIIKEGDAGAATESELAVAKRCGISAEAFAAEKKSNQQVK